MKKEELLKRLEAGECLLVGEYRRGLAETIKWRDKVTKEQLQAPTVRHTIETATKSLTLNERPVEGFKVEDWKQTIPTGTRVVVLVTQYQVQGGAVAVRGTCEPLT